MQLPPRHGGLSVKLLKKVDFLGRNGVDLLLERIPFGVLGRLLVQLAEVPGHVPGEGPALVMGAGDPGRGFTPTLAAGVPALEREPPAVARRVGAGELPAAATG